MSFLQGYRTIIFNFAMLVIMLAQQTGMFPNGAPGPDDVGKAIDVINIALTIVWASGNFLLRWATSTAVFQKAANVVAIILLPLLLAACPAGNVTPQTPKQQLAAAE